MPQPYKNRKERRLTRKQPYGPVADHKEYLRHYYRENKERLAAKKAWLQKHDLTYRLRSILATIVQRCEHPKHTSYKWYGGRGIKNFLTLEDLKTLWLRDGASNMKKPSIDRAHRDDNYEFSKCKFIELADNVRRGVAERDARKSARALVAKG